VSNDVVLSFCRIAELGIMLDWNDLRYFLAVARGGSTLAAGRELKVSQTTVARRIAALEAAIGVPLFDRRQSGYTLTSDGEALLPRAAAVADSARAFADAAAAGVRELRGTVRLSTEEIFSVTLLAPLLRELRELHPEILIDLDASVEVRDLASGETDVALRSISSDPPAGVVGRRLCQDNWAFYCSRDYADRNGVPRTIRELRNHQLVGGGGGNLWRAYSAWLDRLGMAEQVAMHQASSTGLLAAVRSGFGIAVLPCLVADDDPELIRCLPPNPEHTRSMWVLTHERVRHSPRVRVVTDFLYERLKRRVQDLKLTA
jgi:DNA-binding transcriptional LysR family regulator